MTDAITVAGEAPGRAEATFRPRDIALILGSFLVSRLALVAIGCYALSVLTPAGTPVPPGTPIDFNSLIMQWDSYWYLSIVEHGYVTTEFNQPGGTNFAFYPLYPALIWLLSAATGMAPQIAGAVLSNGFFLGALFLLFALCLRWSGDRVVAGFAVMLLCWIPEGFIFSVVYTESLFMLLSMASILLFERKQNLLAGICAGLGSAVRTNGVLIIAYFGLSLIRERGVVGAFKFWREPERYLPIIMTPIGLFVFWWICMLTVGDAFAQRTTLIRGWNAGLDWPWVNIVKHLLSGNAASIAFIVTNLLMFVASLTLLTRKNGTTNWILFAWCFANFLLFWSNTLSNSLLRYAIVLFPIYYGLSLVLAHRRIARTLFLILIAPFSLFLGALWSLGAHYVL